MSNREIKFRAWHNKLKRFAPEHASIQIQGEYPHVAFDMFNGNFDTEVWGIDEVTLMQYTGLKDKKGVEIYEGDIVKSLGEQDYSFGVRVVTFTGGKFTVEGYGLIGSLVEVIGNIYENPELLEN
jgi:uncharacterized phage protein (TIGR01671 family)